MSGITVRYQITKMSYRDFLATYDPSDGRQARVARRVEVTSSTPIEEAQPRENNAMSQPEDKEPGLEPQPEPEQEQENDVGDGNHLRAALDSKDAELEAKDAELEAKDQKHIIELAAKDKELAAKDKELAAKDKDLEELRAQLARLEGVPP